MSGTKRYLEEVLEREGQRRRQKPNKDKNNVPTAARDVAVDAQIAECIKQGVDQAEAERLTLEWNAKQASPMKVGLVKQRVYLAYQAASP